ncbi:unnamed protein product, partial [Prunus brigantina]
MVLIIMPSRSVASFTLLPKRIWTKMFIFSKTPWFLVLTGLALFLLKWQNSFGNFTGLLCV